jgi:hypothetical protein
VYGPPIRETNSPFGNLSFKWVLLLVGCGCVGDFNTILIRERPVVDFESLFEVGNFFSGLWLCMGDFNTILDQGEKRVDKTFSRLRLL